MTSEARLLVRQLKGMAGRPWTQRLVLKGLGLRGPGSEVVVSNERAMRGMIRKVLHLVEVEEVAGAAAGKPAAAPKAGTDKPARPAAKKVKS